MSAIFSIDGREFNVRTARVTRRFELREGRNAGDMMSGGRTRDLIGTYFHYTLAIDPSELDRSEYDALYERLTAAQDSHTLAVPYGQSTLTYEAYIESGADKLEAIEDDNSNDWADLVIEFRSLAPVRTATGG